MPDEHRTSPSGDERQVYGRAFDGFTAKICHHLGYDGVLVDLGEVTTLLSGGVRTARVVAWNEVVAHVGYITDAVPVPVVVTSPDDPECRRAADELGAAGVEHWDPGSWEPARAVLREPSGSYPERLDRLRSSVGPGVVVDGPVLDDALATLETNLRAFRSEAIPADVIRDDGRFDMLTTVLGLPAIYEMEAKYADGNRS